MQDGEVVYVVDPSGPSPDEVSVDSTDTATADRHRDHRRGRLARCGGRRDRRLDRLGSAARRRRHRDATALFAGPDAAALTDNELTGPLLTLVAAPVGAAVGVFLTSEKHLFRYFKDR